MRNNPTLRKTSLTLATLMLMAAVTACGESQSDTNEVTGEVYLMVEGETSLYTVSYTSLNVFQYTADELIQVITAEVEPEETSE